MSKLYTINQLCAMTSVSVRTLHYYDAINLLKPSNRTCKRHRRYSLKDVIKLQKIGALQYLGFSLAQIKSMLDEESDRTSISLFQMQSDKVEEELARLNKAKKILNFAAGISEAEHSVDWKSILKLTASSKVCNSHTTNILWFHHCLSDDELEHFKNNAKKRTNKWLELFSKLQVNLHANPSMEYSLDVVNEWLTLCYEAYGDNLSLIKKLWLIYRLGLIPKDYFPYDKSVINYLSNSFKIYLKEI